MLIPIPVEETSPRACAHHRGQGEPSGTYDPTTVPYMIRRTAIYMEETEYAVPGEGIIPWRALAPLGRGEKTSWRSENWTYCWWLIQPAWHMSKGEHINPNSILTKVVQCPQSCRPSLQSHTKSSENVKSWIQFHVTFATSGGFNHQVMISWD